jgi:hypothetical protein
MAQPVTRSGAPPAFGDGGRTFLVCEIRTFLICMEIWPFVFDRVAVSG